MENESCLFCDSRQMKKRTVLEGRYFFVILDNFPVNRGHALVIPKRHEASLFSLCSKEWIELQEMIEQTEEYLYSKFNPDGFNLGVNCGQAAGQTVFHLHIHLIPRYNGDVKNPRGGIRNFKKPLVAYD